MSQPTIWDKLREKIGGIAFKIYLWSIGMSLKKFWREQEKDALYTLADKGIITIGDIEKLGEFYILHGTGDPDDGPKGIIKYDG